MVHSQKPEKYVPKHLKYSLNQKLSHRLEYAPDEIMKKDLSCKENLDKTGFKQFKLLTITQL